MLVGYEKLLYLFDMIALIMLLIAAVGVIVAGLLFVYVLKHSPKGVDQSAYLHVHGLSGMGNIVAVERTNQKLEGTTYPIVKLTVEISLPGQPVYTSTTEVPVAYRDFPTVGMTVKVLVNPKQKKEFMINE